MARNLEAMGAWEPGLLSSPPAKLPRKPWLPSSAPDGLPSRQSVGEPREARVQEIKQISVGNLQFPLKVMAKSTHFCRMF